MAEAALTVLTSGELSPSTPDVSLLGEALGRTTLESTSEAKASESQGSFSCYFETQPNILRV